MIKLFCAIVGEAGSAFEVDIDDAESVSALKDAIKEKRRNKLNDVDATDLHLFLAKRKQNNEAKEEGEEENGEEKWLTQDEAQKSVRDTSGYTLLRVPGAELRDVGLASDQLGDVSREDKAAGLGHVHVLVLVPRQTFTGKRTRERELFADERILKKRKVDGDDIRYFTMDKFPLMAHQVIKYKRILERDAYRVIFAELMGRVKKYLEIPSQANLVVTGNPGTGKSRFYLYCIFQLLLRHEKEVLELPPAFDLVLNFDDDFQLYDAETKEFIELNANEVRALRRQDRVLRLIEGKSSHLTGWCGVSILFASPGLAGMNDFTKVDSYRYIMPVWSFAELQNYNSLLGDELKLAEDVLVSRYNKFGGIPRFVFTHSEIGEEVQLRQAIQSFDASRIISYVQHDHAVRDNNYSHRVIAMIPSRDDYFEECYLDFLSNHIAEEIVFKLSDESVQEMSHFAIAQAVDDSGYTAVLRGKVYEMLCHRWFSIKLPKQPEPFMLKMRLLSSQPSHTFPNITFEKMKTERFSALKNIETLEQNIYYRPTSKTFGALDAFILIGNDCFGLQMTINQKHGIKHGPLSTFLDELKVHGIAQDHFHFVFLVPSYLGDTFEKQTMQTKNDTDHQRPGGLANVNQYVAAFDVFKENLITSNKSDESSRVVTDGNGNGNGGGNGGGNGNGRGGNGGQGNDGGGDGRHDQVAAVPMGGGGGAPGGQAAAVPVGGGLGALGGQAAAVPRDEGWRDQLQPGQLIDALDTRDIWYESRVLSVSSALLKVHYRGWPSKWDDWIDRTSPRIAPLYSQTRNWRGLNVGDPVMVGRQVTTKICPEWRNAKVTACKNDGCLWVQVDSEEQWIDAQDEMLCPLGMHRASN